MVLANSLLSSQVGQYVLSPKVLAGVQLIFFIVTSMGLCVGLLLKTELI